MISSGEIPVKQPKKVLIVTTVPDTIDAFLLPLVHQLRDRGVTVHALSSGSFARIEQEFDAAHTVGWSRSMSSLLHLRELTSTVRKLVIEEGYDVIHTHTPIASLVVRHALKKLNPHPYVIYTAHGFHFLRSQQSAGFIHWLRYNAYRWMEQSLFQYTDCLVTINTEDYQAAHMFKVDKSTLAQNFAHHIVLLEGVGVELPDTLPAKLPVNHGSLCITIIAEFNANKNHQLLLEALRLMNESGTLARLNVTVLCAGEGPLLEPTKEVATRFGLDGRVEFLGQIPRNAVANLAHSSDIGILVSKREGLPKSLMEFIAMGTCVAGCNTRGIADVVQDQRALCAPTAEALAELLTTLAKDEKLREDIRSAQFTYAKQHFELQSVVEDYMKLYGIE